MRNNEIRDFEMIITVYGMVSSQRFRGRLQSFSFFHCFHVRSTSSATETNELEFVSALLCELDGSGRRGVLVVLEKVERIEELGLDFAERFAVRSVHDRIEKFGSACFVCAHLLRRHRTHHDHKCQTETEDGLGGVHFTVVLCFCCVGDQRKR